ncbi:MAG: nucleotidyltransferase domain-containing protein [Planctomycetes bacterium]|nr:nucleotidyltransferase domain-containing protein [Planctomycetota bacterium]MBI3834299.1 nucleotidyltransferase domain-containing protein [Planctomycetota bacterium]
MVTIIDAQRSELEALCRKYHVRRLEVFGSAADGTFDPARSDIDFLVDFFPFKSGTAFDTYFGLLEDIEALLERRIDLVDLESIRNPFVLRRVNESRKMVYDAGSSNILYTGTQV